jgi:ABC-type transporter Mla maintaining outer membrane lipid asymmetry ATPase subunit MlaF
LACEEAAPGGITDAPLSVKGLHVKHGRKTLVRDVSFDLAPGEAVALVTTGAADPTPLLDVLAGLDPPQAGEISWGGLASGEILRAGSAAARYRLERALRMRIGYITLQSSLLHNQSLFENIALPLRYHLDLPEEEVCERVERALRALHMEGERSRRPSEISRAVRYRAELARAVMLDPSLIIVDSPYLDGDRSAARALGSFLEEHLRPGRTALLAAFEDPARVLSFFTRALIMDRDRGTLVECRPGGPREPGLPAAVERFFQLRKEKEVV